MNLLDAVSLIKHNSIAEKANASWADLGCGSGLFTYALANLLQSGSSIVAIDKTVTSLQKFSNPQNITVHTKQLDFVKDPLPFHNLDGILMANSLHFVADKINFIDSIGKTLSAKGFFLIVEYGTDKSNRWVPFPVSSKSLQALFAKAGHVSFIKLNEMPSLYNTSNIYAAIIKK